MEQIVDFLTLKLQSLKITEGWKVSYNSFYDVNPPLQEEELKIRGLFKNDDRILPIWFLFEDSLLQLSHENKGLSLDLGWGPGNCKNGNFSLTLFRKADKHWEHPLYEFSSRNKDEIVDKLNELMADVSSGKIK